MKISLVLMSSIVFFWSQFIYCQSFNLGSDQSEIDISKRNYYLVKTLGDRSTVKSKDTNFIGTNIDDRNNQTSSQAQQLKVYHVRIISIDKNDVLVIDPNGKSSLLKPDEILSIQKKPFNSPVSLGIGFGLPYGLLGFNGDINIYRNFYFSTGIGIGYGSFPYLCAGGKYYLRSGSYRWRPRVFAFYGNIGGAKIDRQGSLPKIRESYTGTFIGIGQQWITGIKKAWGIDFDIVYITDRSKFTTRMKEIKDEGYRIDFESTGWVKISVGVRYIF